MMVRVLVVDDHPVVRSGLIGMLAVTDDIEVVGEAGDGEEALALVESTRPDVVLMDLRMPRRDGVPRDEGAGADDVRHGHRHPARR